MAIINGTAGNDNIVGTALDDTIKGLGGNDTISGGAGNDFVNGNQGDDFVNGNEGNDTVRGGSGDDTVRGGAGNDELFGDLGDDELFGDLGDDTLYGGGGDDTYYFTTGDGSDTINDTSGFNDKIVFTDISSDSNTHPSPDFVSFDKVGNNLVINLGSAGIIDIIGQYSGSVIENLVFTDTTINTSNIFFGGINADTIIGTANRDFIYGYEGNDILSGRAGNDFIRGNEGNDFINGNEGNDFINGSEGNDTVRGGAGNDIVHGGMGNDIVYGDDGDDTLFGDRGDDTLFGGAGDDILFGGNNNPLLNFGENGNDILNGGVGVDTVDYSDGGAVNIDLLNGTASGGFAEGDTLISIENIIGSDDASERDWIWGDANNNKIEGLTGADILEGGAGADIIDGGDGWDYSRYTRSSAGVNINLETGVNTGGDAAGDTLLNIEAIVGSAFDDTIKGSDNKNYLRGEDGDDTLEGGLVNDQLFGGNGDDIYIYRSGIDTLHEQGAGIDRVVFDAAFDPLSMVITSNSFIFDAGVNELIFNNLALFESFSFDGYTDMTLAELVDLQSTPPSNTIFTDSEEIRVDNIINGNSKNPAITTLLNGSFIITWQADGPDGDGLGVFAQRYNYNGTTSGSEFQVNTYTDNTQSEPSIASLTDGGFIIAWHSLKIGVGLGIYAQRYNADGTTNGIEFQVDTSNDSSEPSIASLADGGFIVTWLSTDAGLNDGIFAQRFNADGTSNGIEFQVNTYISSNQYNMEVSNLSDGGFIITWVSHGQDGSWDGVYAQRYNADGTTNGVEFQVNTNTNLSQYWPEVSNLSDGGFAITWVSNGQDSDGSIGIYAQLYNADGTTNGIEFQVNTNEIGTQLSPHITSLSNGGFVITWNSSSDISGQIFMSDGSRDGSEFQVNDLTLGGQGQSEVSALPDGGFVITWESFNVFTPLGIKSKIFTPISGDNTFFGTSDIENFNGQAGNDTVDYSASALAINVDLLAGSGSAGDSSGDGFISIENIIGSDVASERDWIWGDANDNLILGMAGADILEGGAGADIIDGGDGWDYSRYLRSDSGVNINLETGVNTGGDAAGDVLLNIEAIVGSNYNDVIRGGSNNDYLKGEDGDDFIIGGAGADQLYGGNGADVFVFEAITAFDLSDNIRDFDLLENDVIDISDILVGYDPLTDAISDFVQITDSGVNSILSVDADGGADNFVQIATIYGVTGLTDEDALVTSGNLI